MSLINEALKQAGNESRQQKQASLSQRAALASGSGRRSNFSLLKVVLIVGAALCALMLVSGVTAGIILFATGTAAPPAQSQPAPEANPARDPSLESVAAEVSAPDDSAPTAVAIQIPPSRKEAAPPASAGPPASALAPPQIAKSAPAPKKQPVKRPLVTTPRKTASPDDVGTTKVVSQAPPGTLPARDYQNYVLKAILKGGDEHMALLNSQMVRKGDTLSGGARVAEIKADAVLLEINDELYEISLKIKE